MSVISKLKDAIQKGDWQLVDEVLQDLGGIVVSNNKKEFVTKTIKDDDIQLNKFMINTNNTTANIKESVSKTVFENKFVDDKTLDVEFITENSKVLNPKKQRRPENNSSGFQNVNCSKCSGTIEITNEEFLFKNKDAESSGFVCGSCMKKAARR